MGCDIHLYSETKKDSKWVPDLLHTLTTPTPEELEDGDRPQIDQSYRGRNYALFGLLTNGEVRHDVGFGFPFHQDIPEDTSEVIAADYKAWDSYAHSPNYLTVKQLKEKAMELLVISDPEAREYLPMLTRLIDGLPKTDNPDPEEQRIVFWFDN